MLIAAGDAAMYLASLGDTELDDGLRHLIGQIGAWAEPQGAVTCFVVRFHDESTWSVAAEWHGADVEPIEARRGHDRHHSADGVPHWAIVAPGETVRIRAAEDLPEGSRERAALDRTGARSFLHIPIATGDHVRGVVGWWFEQAPADPTAFVETASGLAVALAVALARLDDLDDPGIALVERLLMPLDDEGRRELFAAYAAEVGRSLGSHRARIMRYDPRSDTTSSLGAWTRPDVSIPTKTSVDPAVHQRADRYDWVVEELRAGRTIRIDDTSTATEVSERTLSEWRLAKTTALLIAPILVEEQLVGWVRVTYVEEPHAWSDREQRRLELFALGLQTVFSRLNRLDARAAADDRAHEQLVRTMELVSQLSHELNTPLHAIAGYAELIDELQLPEPDRRALDGIRAAARLLGSRIEDLIALSRPDASPSSAIDAITSVLDALAPSLEARNVTVSTDDTVVDATLPLSVARARQLVRSIVSGALLAVGPGSRISLTADAARQFSARLDSSTPIAGSSLSFATASAVLHREDRIEIDRPATPTPGYAESIVVQIRFG